MPVAVILGIITLLDKGLEVILKAMEGQPPAVREKLWTLYLEDILKWRAFWDKVFGGLDFTKEDESTKNRVMQLWGKNKADATNVGVVDLKEDK